MALVRNTVLAAIQSPQDLPFHEVNHLNDDLVHQHQEIVAVVFVEFLEDGQQSCQLEFLAFRRQFSHALQAHLGS